MANGIGVGKFFFISYKVHPFIHNNILRSFNAFFCPPNVAILALLRSCNCQCCCHHFFLLLSRLLRNDRACLEGGGAGWITAGCRWTLA
jgi:hypothetical protein